MLLHSAMIAGHGRGRAGVVSRVSNRAICLMFFRPDQFSRSSYVDDNSCLLVSSLPSLLFTMSSHRNIYIYKC
jgi:hypothetical protein